MSRTGYAGNQGKKRQSIDQQKAAAAFEDKNRGDRRSRQRFAGDAGKTFPHRGGSREAPAGLAYKKAAIEMITALCFKILE